MSFDDRQATSTGRGGSSAGSSAGSSSGSAVPDDGPGGDIAISAAALGKAYQIYARPQDRLKQILFGSEGRRFYQEFWAVRGVDLEIRRGETVGIVGRNGSGKSTLLQMICGTLEPTEGDLTVKGRVAALLELGAGFNGEFTGRDNVFLNAAILGMDSAFVAERFDRIAAFADIGPHLDQPVKTYSSGMYARLAFAVAIHVEPQILVVDEALSVGDEAFQRKCFGRIREIRDGGATVLFVSHSGSTIVELCDRAILLDHGERLLTGLPKRVVGKYQRLAYAPAAKAEEIRAELRLLDRAGRQPASGTGVADSGSLLMAEAGVMDAGVMDAGSGAAGKGAAEGNRRDEDLVAYFDPNLLARSTLEYEQQGARISNVRLVDGRGHRVNVLVPGETYRYQYRVDFYQAGFRVRFGMMIKSVAGVELAGMVTHTVKGAIEMVDAGMAVEATFPFVCRLTPGMYFMNAGCSGVVHGGDGYLHRILDAVMFRVMLVEDYRATGYLDVQVGDRSGIEVLGQAHGVIRANAV